VSQSNGTQSVQVLERAVWAGAVTLSVALVASGFLAGSWFTLSVSAGGLFMLMSLWSLPHLARSWAQGAHNFVIGALFVKLWAAAAVLFVLLRFAKFEPLGVVLGMAIAMGAFFVSATLGSKQAAASATEGPNDA
jgi:hypothetical protein